MHFTLRFPPDVDVKSPCNSAAFIVSGPRANIYTCDMRNCTLRVMYEKTNAASTIRVTLHAQPKRLSWGALYARCMELFYDRKVNPLRETGRQWFATLVHLPDLSNTPRPDLHPAAAFESVASSLISLRGHVLTGPRHGTHSFVTRTQAITAFERELDAHLKRMPLPDAPTKKRKR